MALHLFAPLQQLKHFGSPVLATDFELGLDGFNFPIGTEAIAGRLKAIASRVEAIASRLKAIASRVEAIASRRAGHCW